MKLLKLLPYLLIFCIQNQLIKSCWIRHILVKYSFYAIPALRILQSTFSSKKSRRNAEEFLIKNIFNVLSGIVFEYGIYFSSRKCYDHKNNDHNFQTLLLNVPMIICTKDLCMCFYYKRHRIANYNIFLRARLIAQIYDLCPFVRKSSPSEEVDISSR